jgi:uncharacterized protein YuzE
LKFTRYFETIQLRPDRAMIRLEWIQHVIEQPVREVIQADGRIRRRRRDCAQCFLRSFVHAMKIKYFQDTDTLYIEFRSGDIVETKDLDENTQVDVDRGGNICAITIEHAKERADLPHFSFEQVGA